MEDATVLLKSSIEAPGARSRSVVSCERSVWSRLRGLRMLGDHRGTDGAVSVPIDIGTIRAIVSRVDADTLMATSLGRVAEGMHFLDADDELFQPVALEFVRRLLVSQAEPGSETAIRRARDPPADSFAVSDIFDALHGDVKRHLVSSALSVLAPAGDVDLCAIVRAFPSQMHALAVEGVQGRAVSLDSWDSWDSDEECATAMRLLPESSVRAHLILQPISIENDAVIETAHRLKDRMGIRKITANCSSIIFPFFLRPKEDKLRRPILSFIASLSRLEHLKISTGNLPFEYGSSTFLQPNLRSLTLDGCTVLAPLVLPENLTFLDLNALRQVDTDGNDPVHERTPVMDALMLRYTGGRQAKERAGRLVYLGMLYTDTWADPDRPGPHSGPTIVDLFSGFTALETLRMSSLYDFNLLSRTIGLLNRVTRLTLSTIKYSAGYEASSFSPVWRECHPIWHHPRCVPALSNIPKLVNLRLENISRVMTSFAEGMAAQLKQLTGLTCLFILFSPAEVCERVDVVYALRECTQLAVLTLRLLSTRGMRTIPEVLPRLVNLKDLDLLPRRHADPEEVDEGDYRRIRDEVSKLSALTGLYGMRGMRR